MNRNSIIRRVETGLAAIAEGKFVVLADSAEREDEGALILAAEKATPEALAFMIRYTSGIVCVPLPGDRLRELGLPLMVAEHTESQGMEFTVSVDLKLGTTTGISAADRAATIRGLANPCALADDFLRPGHIFPLRAREGGVLKRPGPYRSCGRSRPTGGIPSCGRALRNCQCGRHHGAWRGPRDLRRAAWVALSRRPRSNRLPPFAGTNRPTHGRSAPAHRARHLPTFTFIARSSTDLSIWPS